MPSLLYVLNYACILAGYKSRVVVKHSILSCQYQLTRYISRLESLTCFPVRTGVPNKYLANYETITFYLLPSATSKYTSFNHQLIDVKYRIQETTTSRRVQIVAPLEKKSQKSPFCWRHCCHCCWCCCGCCGCFGSCHPSHPYPQHQPQPHPHHMCLCIQYSAIWGCKSVV